ncbi:hypothetical protein FB45DRAFT_859233 [Roridomyces roridus]|uniref:F-box domain-containing protein n=1 Tax=Roridomyces roridus TaxID=1738132 RepID=A0AAD7G295_9AGAR|nr:hypothetical protein FB45DRAFT_859233 [Roridomyces roridus]
MQPMRRDVGGQISKFCPRFHFGTPAADAPEETDPLDSTDLDEIMKRIVVLLEENHHNPHDPKAAALLDKVKSVAEDGNSDETVAQISQALTHYGLKDPHEYKLLRTILVAAILNFRVHAGPPFQDRRRSSGSCNLLRLPAELLLEIGKLLSTPDLFGLVKSNRALHNLYLPSLHIDVQLKSKRALEAFCAAVRAREWEGKVKHLLVDYPDDTSGRCQRTITPEEAGTWELVRLTLPRLHALQTLHFYGNVGMIRARRKEGRKEVGEIIGTNSQPRIRSFGCHWDNLPLESIPLFKHAREQIQELIIRPPFLGYYDLGSGPMSPVHLPSLQHFSGPVLMVPKVIPGAEAPAERWTIHWDSSYGSEKASRIKLKPIAIDCLAHLATYGSKVKQLSNMLDGWWTLSPMRVACNLPHLEQLRFENTYNVYHSLSHMLDMIRQLDEALPKFDRTLAVLDLERGPANFPRSAQEDAMVFRYECNLLGRWAKLCPSLVDVTLMSRMRFRLLEGKWQAVDSTGVPRHRAGHISSVIEGCSEGHSALALAMDELPYSIVY